MARSHQGAGEGPVRAHSGASVIQFPKLSDREVSQAEHETVSSAPLGQDFVRKLENLIEQRRLRERHFPLDMLADPAWDILLDLALAEHEQRRVTISNLCLAARVPATTALRWIKHMTEDGWLVRVDDRLDGRRVFISLSPKASTKLRAYLTSI